MSGAVELAARGDFDGLIEAACAAAHSGDVEKATGAARVAAFYRTALPVDLAKLEKRMRAAAKAGISDKGKRRRMQGKISSALIWGATLEPAPWGPGSDAVQQQLDALRARSIAKELWEAEQAGPVATVERYADVDAILDDGAEPPSPSVGARRTDGWHILYAAAVNVLFGHPASGKSWVALVHAAEVLREQGRVLYVDLDHNGDTALVSRLVALGVPEKRLRREADLLRIASPGSMAELDAIVADMAAWAPQLAVVDSIGELVALAGGSSNDDSDYTAVHRRVLTALADTGAAVVAIDHLSKGEGSQLYGATGTVAKKRAVDGVMLRVKPLEVMTPGVGGASTLLIAKDRHGAVLAISRTGGDEPVAGVLRLTAEGDRLDYAIHPGRTAELKTADDVTVLRQLDPPPKSKRDVQARLSWGSDRATAALKAFTTSAAATFDLPATTETEPKEQS